MHDTQSIELIDDMVVAGAVRAAIFAALMGAFAYVTFPYPLSPAPVTLQVLAVFLAGILLGPRWGATAMILYLLAGTLGAPIFAGGTAGIGVLLGPHVGFLLSFPIAAFVIGAITHRGTTVTDYRRRSTTWLTGAMGAGVVVIYSFGVIGMMLRLSLSPVEAIMVGAIVFIPAELLKMAAAIGILRSDRLAVE